MKNKVDTPLCPKISTEHSLEILEIQHEFSNAQVAAHTLNAKLVEIDQRLVRRLNELAVQYGIDTGRVEFNVQERKFQLRAGFKGRR